MFQAAFDKIPRGYSCHGSAFALLQLKPLGQTFEQIGGCQVSDGLASPSEQHIIKV